MARRRRTGGTWYGTSRRFGRRGWVATIIVLLVALGSAVDHWQRSRDGATAEQVERRPGTVTKVVDGDTIEVVVDGGSSVKVRLLGIDAPEMTGPGRPFGLTAERYLIARCAGKAVTLRMDELQRDRDKYGRLLAYVYLASDELINESLVRDGMAFAHRRLPCDLSRQFEAAENEARGAKRGMWKTITVEAMPAWRQDWMAERGLN